MNTDSSTTSLPPSPPRPLDAHKGTFGTVIVVGGSKTMIGAPGLCATGALRTGVGLVKIATRASIMSPVLGIEPSATGIILPELIPENPHPFDETDPKRRAILAIGPGLGTSRWAGRWVERLLQGPRPGVVDADGLNLIAENRVTPAPGLKLVMTPHPGEFKRLAEPLGISSDPTDPDSRPAAASQLARAYHAVVVLKGRHTLVTDGERIYRNLTGNPSLATPGSGDVLTGVIASLMAQGVDHFDAAVLGVYLHGLAADIWESRHGPSGLLARDLADLLPDASHRHRVADSASE